MPEKDVPAIEYQHDPITSAANHFRTRLRAYLPSAPLTEHETRIVEFLESAGAEGMRGVKLIELLKTDNGLKLACFRLIDKGIVIVRPYQSIYFLSKYANQN